MQEKTYDRAKRLLDIALAFVLMTLLLPLYLAVGAAVFLSLGRPVLFVQRRPGLNEQLFNLIKFRTMQPGGETESSSESERLTRVGRFLRFTSLDELPSFWNIFRGEMSFVGPRPLLAEYLSIYSDQHRLRHSVKPGLTGLAQVNGRNLLQWRDKLDLDVEYVKSRGFGMDLIIMWQTVKVVTSRKGVNYSDVASAPLMTIGYEVNRSKDLDAG